MASLPARVEVGSEDGSEDGEPPVHDVSDLVALAAAAHPHKLALVEAGGRTLTWAELEEEVALVATGLTRAGALGGRRVLLALGNRLEFVTTYLGVLRAQAVAVPVNPRSTAGEVARVLADSGSRVVVADDAAVGTVRAALEDPAAPDVRPRVHVVGGRPLEGEHPYEELRSAPPQAVPPLRDPEKLAALLYTSGTSGVPRAAMLTHRALLANIDQVAAVEPPMIHGDDVVLGVLPLFHVYGLNAVLGAVLRHRAKLVLVDRFDPEGVLGLIEDEACSVVPVAPPVFAHWRGLDGLAESLGPVRLVLSGSAPLAAETAEGFTEVTGVPVHQGYGLTEAAPVVTSTLCSRATGGAAPGSVGAPLPGVGLRLVDAAGHPVEAGDPGEVEVCGPNLFSGYWPDGADGPGEDGWWRTGDVGLLDAAGDLVLVDRVKELVIVSGFNVFPHEVEDVLEELAQVGTAAVIGVPDEATGEAVVAYVVPADGAAEEQTRAAVEAHCAERLAAYKRPTRVEVVDELPLTVTGKVQKGRLRGYERRRGHVLLDGGPVR